MAYLFLAFERKRVSHISNKAHSTISYSILHVFPFLTKVEMKLYDYKTKHRRNCYFLITLVAVGQTAFFFLILLGCRYCFNKSYSWSDACYRLWHGDFMWFNFLWPIVLLVFNYISMFLLCLQFQPLLSKPIVLKCHHSISAAFFFHLNPK